MAVDKRHLREIAQNAVGALGVAAAAVGPVVPAGYKRTVYFVKIWHSVATTQIATIFRDGAAGAVVMDSQTLPGDGAGGLEIGKAYAMLGKGIDIPVYVLEAGEQVGGILPAGVGHMFICFYDEKG